jgi:outer membrane protein assembly factor BamD (BamD/ComL family)
MKALLTLFYVVFLSFYSSGCEQKIENQIEPRDLIIEQSKSLETPQAQADFLLNQATDLLEKGKYGDAIHVAAYVGIKVDKKSEKAQAIIAEAQAGLKRIAEERFKQKKQ